jgi:hypothetical protein
MINVIIYYLIILSSVLDDGHLFILCFSHVTSTVINSTEKDLSLRSVALDTFTCFSHLIFIVNMYLYLM